MVKLHTSLNTCQFSTQPQNYVTQVMPTHGSITCFSPAALVTKLRIVLLYMYYKCILTHVRLVLFHGLHGFLMGGKVHIGFTRRTTIAAKLKVHTHRLNGREELKREIYSNETVPYSTVTISTHTTTRGYKSELTWTQTSHGKTTFTLGDLSDAIVTVKFNQDHRNRDSNVKLNGS